MCNAVSGITKSDTTIFMPSTDSWDHSHTAIAKLHGIPDGVFGDTYARWECSPKDGNFQSDPDTWAFKLDEKRAPAWWKDDASALEDAARRSTKRYMQAASAAGVAPGSTISTSGYGAPASTSGYGAPASTSGDAAPASTSGYGAPASTSGVRAPASTSGDGAPASTSGDGAPASTSGYAAPASTSGDEAPASTSGVRAPASTSGVRAPASTSGDGAPASTSGVRAPASTSGVRAPASTSGARAPASTSGARAPASTSGYGAPASTSGDEAPAVGVGAHARVKCGQNGVLVVAERDTDWKLIGWVFGVAGKDGIKPHTWYKAEGGKLVEADDEITREADAKAEAARKVVGK